MTTPSPSAGDVAKLVEELRDATIDWTGEPIVDGSTPRYEIHCRPLREAATALESLSRELAEAREAIGHIRSDVGRYGQTCLDEAEHAEAVGSSETRFASVTAAAVLSRVLDIIERRSPSTPAQPPRDPFRPAVDVDADDDFYPSREEE